MTGSCVFCRIISNAPTHILTGPNRHIVSVIVLEGDFILRDKECGIR